MKHATIELPATFPQFNGYVRIGGVAICYRGESVAALMRWSVFAQMLKDNKVQEAA